MNERVHSMLIKVSIVGMAVGIVGMIQPLTILLFKPGFLALLYSTLVYSVVSQITPRRAEPGGVEAERVVQAEAETRG